MIGHTATAKELFAFLEEHLDPNIKKRLEPGALRELLFCVVEWIYVDRKKNIDAITAAMVSGTLPEFLNDVSADLKLVPAGRPEGSFLDALKDIG